MERTKQIKRGRNYKKPKTETIRTEIQSNPFLKGYKENLKKSNIDSIEELTKQFNDMKINYVQLIKKIKKRYNVIIVKNLGIMQMNIKKKNKLKNVKYVIKLDIVLKNVTEIKLVKNVKRRDILKQYVKVLLKD